MKTLAILMLALSCAACAQDAAPTGGRPAPSTHIVTRTRTVAIFDDLEQQLMAAVQKKDKVKLTELATDDFELRRASDPATPEPRDAWIANDLPTYELKDFRFTKMAVHLFNEDTAVVSMNYWQNATMHGKDGSGDYFLVDVWTKHNNNWKLSVRYVSPIAPTGHIFKLKDVKPTGKQ